MGLVPLQVLFNIVLHRATFLTCLHRRCWITWPIINVRWQNCDVWLKFWPLCRGIWCLARRRHCYSCRSIKRKAVFEMFHFSNILSHFPVFPGLCARQQQRRWQLGSRSEIWNLTTVSSSAWTPHTASHWYVGIMVTGDCAFAASARGYGTCVSFHLELIYEQKSHIIQLNLN